MADNPPQIFLNHATPASLQDIEGVTPHVAQILIAGRPYRSWEDVQRAEVPDACVKALQSHGVELGEPSSGPIGEPGSGGSGGSPGGNFGRA